MSSTAYSAEIRPDGQLRLIVLVTGTTVTLLGALAVVLMTAPAAARWTALVAWVVFSCRELLALRRGWRRCRGARFLANGDVEIRGDGGAWERAELADGSVLLRRYGWLRLVAADGVVVHELVRGRRREDRDWRRLHVIWRHV